MAYRYSIRNPAHVPKGHRHRFLVIFLPWLKPFCLWQNAVLFWIFLGLWNRYILQFSTEKRYCVYSSETEDLALAFFRTLWPACQQNTAKIWMTCTSSFSASSSGVYFREQVESSQMKVRWEPRETARQGHSPNHEEQSRSGGSTLCQTKIHWLPNGSVVLSQSQITKTRLDTAYLQCSSARAMGQNLSSNATLGPKGRGCVDGGPEWDWGGWYWCSQGPYLSLL